MATFVIGLHQKDRALLELIQSSWSVGKIYIQSKCMLHYRIQSIKELQVIIDHFDKYPLITQKLSDYILFKQAVELIKNKEHLTEEGLHKIVAIKASMNLGLSESLKADFPDVKPVPRPVVLNQKIKNPEWVSGFSSGEGCFNIVISHSSSNKIGFSGKIVRFFYSSFIDELRCFIIVILSSTWHFYCFYCFYCFIVFISYIRISDILLNNKYMIKDPFFRTILASPVSITLKL